MAMSTTNLKDEAIAELQAELTKNKRSIDVEMDQIRFIFGLDADLNGDELQVIMQDAADWFDAQEWVTRSKIYWSKAMVRLLYRESA